MREFAGRRPVIQASAPRFVAKVALILLPDRHAAELQLVRPRAAQITEHSPSKLHCKQRIAARMASQTSKPTVTVLDYGAGNVRSVINALELLGCSVDLVRTARDVRAAEILVFPGVGCFAAAMDALDQARCVGRPPRLPTRQG